MDIMKTILNLYSAKQFLLKLNVHVLRLTDAYLKVVKWLSCITNDSVESVHLRTTITVTVQTLLLNFSSPDNYYYFNTNVDWEKYLKY